MYKCILNTEHFTERCYVWRGLCCRKMSNSLSVRPSVCHIHVLCRNR